VETSTALLWETTVSQKNRICNRTFMVIYNILKEWSFQQHSYGNVQYPRKVEASTSLLRESTHSQKSRIFNNTLMEKYNIPEERKLQ
jgi:hypothetical protein